MELYDLILKQAGQHNPKTIGESKKDWEDKQRVTVILLKSELVTMWSMGYLILQD